MTPIVCDYCHVEVHVRQVDDDTIELYCPYCGRYRAYIVERVE
jgi:hypothetical protein